MSLLRETPEDAPELEAPNEAILASQLMNAAVDRWLASISGSSSELGRIADWIRGILPDAMKKQAASSGLRNLDDLGFLRFLLDALERRDAQWLDWDGGDLLRDTALRAIKLLSLETSMAAATERSARRQVYNLAYGLTHEINNPLGNIVARAQQLIGSASNEGDRKSLATIVDQAMKAHEMLAEVMRAVQPRPLPLTVADASCVVHSIVEGLRHEAETQSVHWVVQKSSESLFAYMDIAAFGEALRLLARNALEICRPNDSVTWTCEAIAEPRPMLGPEGSEGELRITVRDTGPGLSPEAQRGALDLFYSGREHGRGLGISLAVVRRIVEAHSGRFCLRSELNAGCTAEITLPRTAAPRTQRERARL